MKGLKMCINPSFIWQPAGDGHIQIPTVCGSCWRCKQNKTNDWVGRCLCEAEYSDWTITITLTYAPRDDGAEKITNKNHFQDFIRALRDGNHKIRYFAVSERGDLRGRVHFHAVLFGRGEYPCGYYDNAEAHRKESNLPRFAPRKYLKSDRWPNDLRRTWLKQWPHGHVVIDEGMSAESVAYCVKYLNKDEKQWFSCSKKPLIGAEWIIAKGKEYARLGVLPSSFRYRPPNANPKYSYTLSGASRRLLIKTIFEDTIYSHLRWAKPEHENDHIDKAFRAVQKQIWRNNPLADGKEFLEQFEKYLDTTRRSSASINREFLQSMGYVNTPDGWIDPDEAEWMSWEKRIIREVERGGLRNMKTQAASRHSP